jgi:O-antigen ligase
VFINFVSALQEISLLLLLVFTPLAGGATTRWAFCISLWLALTATTAMVVKRLRQGQSLLPRTALEASLALLLSLVLISLHITIYRAATDWALLRLLLYVNVFYLTLDLTASRRQTRRLILTIITMGTILAFLGFVKLGGGPFPSFWVYSNIGPEVQLSSTFINHNHLAGYLEMVFALGLGMLLQRPVLHPLALGSLLILILSAILLSMSRGGWIATFAGSGSMLLIFALVEKPNKWKIAATVVCFVLVGSLSFLGSNAMIERLESLRDPAGEPNLGFIRFPVWSGCLQLIRENPWWGKGLGTFPWSFAQVRPSGLGWRFREAHNDYLQIVTEMGLTVLLPLACGLYVLFRTAILKLRKQESHFARGVTLGSLGGIIALLVHSISDFNLQITSNGILFSLLFGLAVAAGKGSDAENPF